MGKERSLPRAKRRYKAKTKTKPVPPRKRRVKTAVSPIQEHPLENRRNSAALAVFGCFTGVGVTMIDPRFVVGVGFCLLGLGGTLWLYWRALKVAKLFQTETWPKLGIAVIALQIIIPVIVIVMHVTDAKPAQVTEGDIQRIQNSPQTNCFNMHIKDSEFSHGGTGISIGSSGCTNLDLDGTKIHDMSGLAIERRP